MVLPVLNVGDGPSYLGNITFQPLTKANNSTVDNYYIWLDSINGNASDALKVMSESSYASGNTGKICLNITNFGNSDLHVTAIDIYNNTSLFASASGSFTLGANSIANLTLDVSNIEKLSNTEAQWLTTQINRQENESIPHINYIFKVETSEGITLVYNHFTFPTYPELFLEGNLKL